MRRVFGRRSLASAFLAVAITLAVLRVVIIQGWLPLPYRGTKLHELNKISILDTPDASSNSGLQGRYATPHGDNWSSKALAAPILEMGAKSQGLQQRPDEWTGDIAGDFGLTRAIAARRILGELILVVDTGSRIGLVANLALNLENQGYKNTLIVLDSEASCSRLREVSRLSMTLGCAWSSHWHVGHTSGVSIQERAQIMRLHTAQRIHAHDTSVLVLDVACHVMRDIYTFLNQRELRRHSVVFLGSNAEVGPSSNLVSFSTAPMYLRRTFKKGIISSVLAGMVNASTAGEPRQEQEPSFHPCSSGETVNRIFSSSFWSYVSSTAGIRMISFEDCFQWQMRNIKETSYSAILEEHRGSFESLPIRYRAGLQWLSLPHLEESDQEGGALSESIAWAPEWLFGMWASSGSYGLWDRSPPQVVVGCHDRYTGLRPDERTSLAMKIIGHWDYEASVLEQSPLLFAHPKAVAYTREATGSLVSLQDYMEAVQALLYLSKLLGRVAVLPSVPCKSAWVTPYRAKGAHTFPVIAEGLKNGSRCHWVNWTPFCSQVAIHEAELNMLAANDERYPDSSASKYSHLVLDESDLVSRIQSWSMRPDLIGDTDAWNKHHTLRIGMMPDKMRHELSEQLAQSGVPAASCRIVL